MFVAAKTLIVPALAAALMALPLQADTTTTATTETEITTVATAEIAGPLTAEDLAEGTAVMVSSGEIVGKVVSIVPVENAANNLIVQVDGTDESAPEKNVLLSQEQFGIAASGNYVVNMTLEDFMAEVAAQNPA